MDALSVSIERAGTRTILRVQGEMDITTVPIVRSQADSEIEAPECHVLELDLAGVDFIDSSGIGYLVELRNHAQKAGRELQLGRAAIQVVRILELGGMSHLFAPVTPDPR